MSPLNTDSKFQFQQFEIQQFPDVFKVCTDSVVLGAWANLESARKILDVGTGSGLLALISACRNKSAHITGIEASIEAVHAARINFKASKWKERLEIAHMKLSRQMPFKEKFDYVITNPPYFERSMLPKDPHRSGSRHQHNISLLDWINWSSNLMHPGHGILGLVLPVQVYRNALSGIELMGLNVKRACFIHPIAGRQANRVLAELVKYDVAAEREDIALYKNQKQEKTSRFSDLVAGLYLKH